MKTPSELMPPTSNEAMNKPTDGVRRYELTYQM